MIAATVAWRAQSRCSSTARETRLAGTVPTVENGVWIHDAMLAGRPVKPHHRDPVTAGLARAASGQQPQLPCALHGRGPVTDLEAA